jgi:hypothetical protein
MDNRFTSKMTGKSNYELTNIIDRQEIFDKEAVFAALIELQKRTTLTDTQLKIKTDIESRIEKEKQEIETIEKQNFGLPELFSKQFIFIVSFLLNPIFGTIFFSINLWDLKLRRTIILTILIMVTYLIIQLTVIQNFEKTFSVVTITNLIGTAILTELLWSLFIGRKREFIVKKIF